MASDKKKTEKETLYKERGERVAGLIAKHGVTHLEIEAKTGITRQVISRLVNGHPVSDRTLELLAEYFDVPLRYLVSGHGTLSTADVEEVRQLQVLANGLLKEILGREPTPEEVNEQVVELWNKKRLLDPDK